MKAETILLYILLLYIIICSLFLLVGLFSFNHYLGCVLIGCCMFLLYYVLRYIGNFMVKCTHCLLKDRVNYNSGHSNTNVGDLFSRYPLYARRMICLYNKQNFTTVGNTLINDLRKVVDTKDIYDELPYELIQQLRIIDLDDNTISETENRLATIIDLYQKYPKALSFVFRHSSLDELFRYSARKSSSIQEIFSLADNNLVHHEFNEHQLRTIEDAVDNKLFLDSHLYDLNPIKPDAESIIKHLKNNYQEYLYHFTHKDNIEQIKKLCGLYSWVQLDKMGKTCQHPGGDSLSRKLDTKYGLADYVHLSFSYKHPMSFKKEDIVVLYIHPIVCLLPDTLFCDMNATDKNHSIGASYKDLEKINLWNTKMGYLDSGTRQFKEKQSEVLVKSHIPLHYIINIDFV